MREFEIFPALYLRYPESIEQEKFIFEFSWLAPDTYQGR